MWGFLKNVSGIKSWKAEKWGLVALVLGSILTGAIHFISQESIFQSTETANQLNHQYFISYELRDMEKSLIQMESNVQSYSLTRQENYEVEVAHNMQQVARQLGKIEEVLLSESSILSKAFLELKKSIELKVTFTQEFLAYLQADGKEHEHHSTYELRGAEMSNDLVKAIEAFTLSEGIDINRVLQEGGAHNRRILIFNNIAYILGLGLVVIAIIYFFRSFQQRIELEKNLVHALQEVQEAARTKERFLANMSHEIRTPLQAILGFANLLQKEKLPEKHSQNIRNIKLAGNNLLEIVNDILDVSKIESGMLRQEKVPFSLAELMDSIEKMFQAKALEKNIFLKTQEIQDLPCLLIGDPSSLTRILVNLISNSLKFTHVGGIEIKTVITEIAPGEIRLRIEVKDSGIGISEEKLPFIFDRFEQVDSNITRVYGGSGLGLYIVKQLVELQQGKIEVQSEVGKGSTFSVEIPYKMSEMLREELSSGRLDTPLKGFEGVRILLVEDNLLNQRVLGSFLAQWGVDYDLATHGKMAIHLLEKESYQLILMDVQMPEMDGYSATEYIRENMKISTPIIAMTAHAFPGEREKALGFGMNDYLSKPVAEQDLYPMLARFIPELMRSSPSRIDSRNSGLTFIKADSNEVHVDYSFLLESARGNKEYLKGIFELFFQQAEQELTAIKNALAQGKAELIRKNVHSLKSTAGYAGLTESFLPLLEEIEIRLKDYSSAESLRPLVQKLESRIHLAIQKIKTEAMPFLE